MSDPGSKSEKQSWFRRHFLREDWRDVTVHRGRGLFGSNEQKPPTDIKDYYSYYDGDGADPSVAAAVDSIADGAVGRGFDLEPARQEKDPDYEKAVEAKQLCADFARYNNLDELNPNIVKNMILAGYLPVESLITSVPEKAGLYMIDPRTITKINWDDSHTRILSVTQELAMKAKDLFPGELLTVDPAGVEGKELLADPEIGGDLAAPELPGDGRRSGTG